VLVTIILLESWSRCAASTCGPAHEGAVTLPLGGCGAAGGSGIASVVCYECKMGFCSGGACAWREPTC